MKIAVHPFPRVCDRGQLCHFDARVSCNARSRFSVEPCERMPSQGQCSILLLLHSIAGREVARPGQHVADFISVVLDARKPINSFAKLLAERHSGETTERALRKRAAKRIVRIDGHGHTVRHGAPTAGIPKATWWSGERNGLVSVAVFSTCKWHVELACLQQLSTSSGTQVRECGHRRIER